MRLVFICVSLFWYLLWAIFTILHSSCVFSPSRSSVHAALVCSFAILALFFPFFVGMSAWLPWHVLWLFFFFFFFLFFRFAFFSLCFHLFFVCLKGSIVGMCSDVIYVRCMRRMLRASSRVRTKSNGRLNCLSKRKLYTYECTI